MSIMCLEAKSKCFNETVAGETQEITMSLNIESLNNSTKERKSWITVTVIGRRNFYYDCATSKITKFYNVGMSSYLEFINLKLGINEQVSIRLYRTMRKYE